VVTVRASEPTAKQWKKIDDAFRSRVGFAAQLLAGDLPPSLEDVFRDARVELFPATWRDLRAACSCPDHENPCKHIAAVLYVFADQLDADPWLLLRWRGRTREEILDQVRGSVTSSAGDVGLPPWWPLVPDRNAASGEPIERSVLPPDPPHRVLQRLSSLGAEVGGESVEQLLEPLYAVIVEPDVPDVVLANE
jgi:uncharacterized Zn finger protein